MAINFTDSPANGATQVVDGRTYTYNSTKNKWDTTATEVTTTLYATIDDLPLSGVSAGAQAYVSGNNRLYIWNGTGWYNIALINTAPSISGVSSSYALATDGTATTVTITATDPEGLPITYSIASDTSGNTATVAQSGNVFTITPSTDSANAGTFSITFRASDGVNIATAVSEFTLQFRVANSNYTTALITTAGSAGTNATFTDSSSNSQSITAYGNTTQTSFSPYRHGGYSTYFDGSGDYLSVPNDTSLQLGNSDFTIEAWIYPTAIDSGGVSVIMGKYDPSPNLEWFLGFTSSVLRIRYSVNGTSVVGNIDVSYAVSFNTWTHIAVSRTGNTLKFFADGVQIGSDVAFSSTFYQGTGAFGISNGNNDDTVRFIGNITDLRVVKGTAVYTANFTPPTERLTAITNTSLLACHLPYIADGSANDHSITVNGNVLPKPFAPYDYQEYTVGSHGASAYFDGSGDYLNIPAGDWKTFGTDNFTMEMWFNTSDTGSQYLFADINSGGSNNTSTVMILLNGGVPACYIQDTTYNLINGSTSIRPNHWHHIAVVRNGATVTLYLDGKSEGTYNIGTAAMNTSTEPGSLGRWAFSSSNDYTGYISDFRVVKGTAVYTANFTLPTAPLTAITNTSLLLDMQGAKILDKSQSTKNLTLAGDTTASTAQYKYLPTSMYFDGTGDYISMPTDTFAFGTDDFTIEFWIYHTSATGYQTPFDLGYIDPGSILMQTANNSLAYVTYHGGTLQLQESGSFSTNTWYHIALVRNGGTMTLYRDGTASATGTYSNNYNYSGAKLSNIGAGHWNSPGTNPITGYISDFRVAKGLARYTANFTPPSAALDG